MADIFTPEKRSYVMSRIRSKGTKVERQMQSLLEDANISFEAHPDMFGSPDFVAGKRVLVFCDGTFWHGYNYRNGKVPHQKFWREKIERNMRRDKRNGRKLRAMGYSVLRFWEHDVAKRPEYCVRKIKQKL